MKLDLYQIDAFTDKIFGGNPACVVPLQQWLPDETLLKIAQENAVAETAFFIESDCKIKLRWFTPEIEMDLCGHATLASAYVLKKILNYSKDKIIFDTASGDLIVTTDGDLFMLDFPSRKPVPADLPPLLLQSLNKKPRQILKDRDFVLVYDSQQCVEQIEVNRQIFDQTNLHPGGVIFTAKGDSCDFVSRFFTPQSSILEDPVTGSAHCSLIPYWSERLGKKNMVAMQISARKGRLICEDRGERVLISGTARTYLTGSIFID